jgi:hypothetical protein
MIPEMRNLLERLKGERRDTAPDANVMMVRECRKPWIELPSY